MRNINDVVISTLNNECKLVSTNLGYSSKLGFICLLYLQTEAGYFYERALIG